jgi:hypothetical protein
MGQRFTHHLPVIMNSPLGNQFFDEQAGNTISSDYTTLSTAESRPGRMRSVLDRIAH